jgi:hypothetical protein
MNPTPITLWLSLIVAIICCVVVYVWTWALCRVAADADRAMMSTPKVTRSTRGDALILRGETDCPDCKYGEPCAKCLGVVQ